MAGLARVQQRFNAAVVAVLTLAGFSRMASGKSAAKQAATGFGHPLHAKYLKSNAPKANTPGRRYPGYCFGRTEAKRRVRQEMRSMGLDINDNLDYQIYLKRGRHING